MARARRATGGRCRFRGNGGWRGGCWLRARRGTPPKRWRASSASGGCARRHARSWRTCSAARRRWMTTLRGVTQTMSDRAIKTLRREYSERVTKANNRQTMVQAVMFFSFLATTVGPSSWLLSPFDGLNKPASWGWTIAGLPCLVPAIFFNRHFESVEQKAREKLRSEEHTSALQSLMRISYA